MESNEDDEIGVRIAIRDADLSIYENAKKRLIVALNRFGGYVPEIDEIIVDQVASAYVYWKTSEVFLDADTATEHTYARMADAKAKFQKMMNDGFRELALSRRDRLNKQGQSDLTNELRLAILKGREK